MSEDEECYQDDFEDYEDDFEVGTDSFFALILQAPISKGHTRTWLSIRKAVQAVLVLSAPSAPICALICMDRNNILAAIEHCRSVFFSTMKMACNNIKRQCTWGSSLLQSSCCRAHIRKNNQSA